VGADATAEQRMRACRFLVPCGRRNLSPGKFPANPTRCPMLIVDFALPGVEMCRRSVEKSHSNGFARNGWNAGSSLERPLSSGGWTAQITRRRALYAVTLHVCNSPSSREMHDPILGRAASLAAVKPVAARANHGPCGSPTRYVAGDGRVHAVDEQRKARSQAPPR